QNESRSIRKPVCGNTRGSSRVWGCGWGDDGIAVCGARVGVGDWVGGESDVEGVTGSCVVPGTRVAAGPGVVDTSDGPPGLCVAPGTGVDPGDGMVASDGVEAGLWDCTGASVAAGGWVCTTACAVAAGCVVGLRVS